MNLHYCHSPPSPLRLGLSTIIHAPFPQRKDLSTSIHASSLQSEEDLCASIYAPSSPPKPDSSASIHAPCTPPKRSLNTSVHASSQHAPMEPVLLLVVDLSPERRARRAIGVIDPWRVISLCSSAVTLSLLSPFELFFFKVHLGFVRHAWICTSV